MEDLPAVPMLAGPDPGLFATLARPLRQDRRLHPATSGQPGPIHDTTRRGPVPQVHRRDPGRGRRIRTRPDKAADDPVLTAEAPLAQGSITTRHDRWRRFPPPRSRRSVRQDHAYAPGLPAARIRRFLAAATMFTRPRYVVVAVRGLRTISAQLRIWVDGAVPAGMAVSRPAARPGSPAYRGSPARRPRRRARPARQSRLGPGPGRRAPPGSAS